MEVFVFKYFPCGICDLFHPGIVKHGMLNRRRLAGPNDVWRGKGPRVAILHEIFRQPFRRLTLHGRAANLARARRDNNSRAILSLERRCKL